MGTKAHQRVTEAAGIVSICIEQHSRQERWHSHSSQTKRLVSETQYRIHEQSCSLTNTTPAADHWKNIHMLLQMLLLLPSSLSLSALFFLFLFIFFIRTQNQHPEVSEKLFKNINSPILGFHVYCSMDPKKVILSSCYCF